MQSITKASRIRAVTQVITYMNSGMTVVDACREVGMPRNSFYHIVENNPQAIANIQAIIDINNREKLVLILYGTNIPSIHNAQKNLINPKVIPKKFY